MSSIPRWRNLRDRQSRYYSTKQRNYLYSDTTIIIPTLNEGANIGRMVALLKKLYRGVTVIVADDGSTDGTQMRAREHGSIVIDRTRRKIKGITASVVEALGHVMTPFFIVMDGDFQHPPEKIGLIREKLADSTVVIGVRRRVIGHWGFFRKMQSRIATSLAHVRLRAAVRDPLSGLFGASINFVRGLDLRTVEPRCFKILFNILKNSDLTRVRIDYVPYDFRLRKHGESKIRAKHVWYFIRSLVT